MGLERINLFKRELGMTNEKLSSISGVPKSTIDKITSGLTQNPNIETVRAIVTAMGKTLDDLEESGKAKKSVQDELTFDDFTFALFDEVRELSDEEKEEILNNARFFNKMRKLEKQVAELSMKNDGNER